MSDLCPHCDDFSIDASRARRASRVSDQGKRDSVKKTRKSKQEKATGTPVGGDTSSNAAGLD